VGWVTKNILVPSYRNTEWQTPNEVILKHIFISTTS